MKDLQVELIWPPVAIRHAAGGSVTIRCVFHVPPMTGHCAASGLAVAGAVGFVSAARELA